MIISWIVFPVLMLAACTGCGLLLEAVSGWRLPGTLVPVAGLAVAVVAVSLTTNSTATSEASTPLLCALSVAGLVLGRARLRELALDRWAVSIGFATFAICAAPVVLSGNATFLGYYVLNDSSFHLSLANLLVGHGPNMTDLPQDGYTALTGSYIVTDYPTGADVVLGALSRVLGQNVTWTFQPYIAVAVAFGVVALYELLADVVASKPLRSACALIAGLNGLLYSLYIVASIKELVTITILTLLVCVVLRTLEHLHPRGLVPGIVITAAAFDVLGITAVPWVGVPVAAFALCALWRLRAPIVSAVRRPGAVRIQTPLRWIAPLLTAAALGLIATWLPILDKAPTFFNVSKDVLTSASDTGAGALGYLVGPLRDFQILGIWPDYDFRFPLVQHVDLTFILIGVELASAVLGTVWLLRKRGWGPLLLVVGNGVAAIYLLHRSTPYAASKVLLIVSAAVVLIVTLGAGALHDGRRRIEAWILIAVLAAGVLWTDALAYRYDSVAPSGKLHELASIDNRFSGQGPALYPYGQESLANYVLHDLDPSTADQPGVTPRSGLTVTPFQMYQLRWDTDNLSQTYLDSFRLLIMDRSPAFSRPGANFELVDRGRYYDVWRRSDQIKVIKHVGFGTYPYSAAVPACSTVKATARVAAHNHARLAYVLGAPTATLIPAAVPHPSNWVPVADDPDELIPRQGPGTLTNAIRVPRAGDYQVWFDGSFGQKFTVTVDGRQIGSIQNQLGPLQQATQIATVHLTTGLHVVTIARQSASWLTPGQDDPNPNNRAVGPLMFVDGGPDYSVHTIAPTRAATLCGRSLDWLEVIRTSA